MSQLTGLHHESAADKGKVVTEFGELGVGCPLELGYYADGMLR